MDLEPPLPVVHPVEWHERLPGRGGTMRNYVRTITPVRLVRHGRDAFGPLKPVRIGLPPERPFGIPPDSILAAPVVSVTPITPYIGPGGLWTPFQTRDGVDVTPEAFAAWLRDESVAAAVTAAGRSRFGATPLGTRRTHPTSRERSERHCYRGCRPGRTVPVWIDAAAATAMVEWVSREVAISSDDRVMTRWRPYLTWRLGSDRAGDLVMKAPYSFADLPITPANWPAVAAMHAATTGESPNLRETDWLTLADAWPHDPDADALMAVTNHAFHLHLRCRDRLNDLRNGADPGASGIAADAAIHALGGLVPVLNEIARRADIGLAGAGAAGAGDIDAFRQAVILESTLAGRHARKTGINHLRDYLAAVAALAPAAPGPDDDALAGMAP